MIFLSELLLEDGGTPSEQAKALGLIYGGFGQWLDAKTRKTKARTIDGKLVKVGDDDDDEIKEDLGRITILNFDPGILQPSANKVPEEKKKAYDTLIQKILHFGGDFVVFTARTQEMDVAKYLKSIGVSAGVKLAPFSSSDPQKKRKYVEKKIKAGYSHIKYFDFDKKDVAAIESLKPPYNKLKIRIETFSIPTLSGEAPKDMEG